MEIPSGVFHFTRLEEVVFGAGAVREIGAAMDRRDLRRAVIVTGKTLGASALLGKVTDALGTRCAAVFKEAAQHVPAPTVRALAAEMRRVDADTVVSFGGGSPIDTAKVAIASVINDRDMTLEGGALDWRKAHLPMPNANPFHIAIPTTLSAGEYTAGGGVTSEVTGKKAGVIDPRLQPRLVINDPTLTMATPEWLWVSTGIRALDHAVEASYAPRHQIFTDMLAAKSIALMTAHLPQSITTTGDARLYHRGHCQTAAWLSLYGMSDIGLGVSHAIGHKIGPTWNVPHGYTSCITLPTAMRFMAERAPQRFAPIAEGLGIAFDPANPHPAALQCADRVDRFIAGFDVPHSLKEAGVPHGEIQKIAEPAAEEINFARALERPITLDEVRLLIDAVWERRAA
ncbi:MAG: iron-containing alcohol dehydrogenase [Stellaceae bacterium]